MEEREMMTAVWTSAGVEMMTLVDEAPETEAEIHERIH